MSANIKQPHVRIYWRAGAVDVALRTRLESDVKRGRGTASGICRRALAQYYGLDPKRPAPDADLTARVDQLAQQVAALTSLAATVDALRAENARLLQLLLDASFGDKTQRLAAARHARTALDAVRNGNGNGHG